MPIQINGWELHPEPFTPKPFKIGGPIRRSLNGTGYQKTVATKQRLTLAWSAMTEDEYQTLKVIWEQAKSGVLTVSCSDPVVSGSFFIRDEEWPFEMLEGASTVYRGVLTLEEQ